MKPNLQAELYQQLQTRYDELSESMETLVASHIKERRKSLVVYEEYATLAGEASGLQRQLDAVVIECERVKSTAGFMKLSSSELTLIRKIVKLAKGETSATN